MKFSDKQINVMRAAFAKFDRINPDGPSYQKMIEMLDEMPKPLLAQVAGSGIKFLSVLALNRVNNFYK